MFAGVTGAADDRMFVLDSVPAGNYPARSHAWYLMRIDKGTGLTRLPIAGPAVSAQIQGLALSPDGGTLALLFQPGALSAPLTLRTYSLASGRALRTWTTPSPNGSPVSMTPSSDNYAVLSWIGERALAFRYPVYTVPYSLRTLSLASKGGDFLKASEFAMADPGDRHDCAGPRIATDGRTVVCGTLGSATGSCVQEQPGFDLLSTATGKLIRVLLPAARRRAPAWRRRPSSRRLPPSSAAVRRD